MCVHDRLPRYACQFIEMCLMVTADHGPAVSGAHNTIVCARAGKDLISSLTSGLLTIVRPVTLTLLLYFLCDYIYYACIVCVFRVTGLVGLWMLPLSSSVRLLTAACCPWSLSTRWRKMANWSWALGTELNLWVITKCRKQTSRLPSNEKVVYFLSSSHMYYSKKTRLLLFKL